MMRCVALRCAVAARERERESERARVRWLFVVVCVLFRTSFGWLLTLGSLSHAGTSLAVNRIKLTMLAIVCDMMPSLGLLDQKGEQRIQRYAVKVVIVDR
jgi:hypothetical protein